MIANIYNESFGYSTTCFDNWAAIGNPSIVRFNPATGSLKHTGSVEIYKYNINTDTHDFKTILRRHASEVSDLFLSTEITNSIKFILHTELTGSIPYSADLDLLIDIGSYFTASDDAYGVAIDMQNAFLAIGCPYFSSTISPGSVTSSYSGSMVDIYDLSKLDIDPYANRLLPTITAFGTSSGIITASINVPANQQYSYVILESQDLSSISNPWNIINLVAVYDVGGLATLSTGLSSITNYDWRVRGLVGTDPYLTTISNPNLSVSESFGSVVSINDAWLAIGSPLESGSRGVVYMYQQKGGSEVSWSLYQTLLLPSEIGIRDNFGKSICLNKATGSYSASMVVGTAKVSQSRAYVYEFDGTSWTQKFTLHPDYTTAYPLTFYPTLPFFYGAYPNYSDAFGWSVGMFKDTIIVGAPTDRHIYEYTGSSVYNEGSVYFFERCPYPVTDYYLARKSYGNEKTLVNNRLGESVGVFHNYAVAGCPKTNMLSMSICYLRGALFQQHYCGNSENQIQGQFILYQQTTGSIPDSTNLDWGIVNVYQTKKRILNPYRVYGFDTSICHNFITVGSPMLISGSQRIMDMNPDSGSFTGSLSDLNDITGKAYIYNLKNLRDQFYVGNVFYRNGKLVVMSSGSAFDGLLMSGVPGEQYEYDLFFQSKYTIFEKQIVCNVEIGEFNVSTNPTAIVLPMSDYDINQNGMFDFQDCDVLLRYMKYKSTEASGNPVTDWSSSLLTTNTDEDVSVYNMYSSSWDRTDYLFTSNYSTINNTLYTKLDYNEDNKIDINDMNILWKYFINRLTQKNYDTYITPNSNRKYLSDVIDYLNGVTMKNKAPAINSNFTDYGRLSKLDPTGSYLAPYVTSVGLYSGCDLVAVAKLGSPIKIIPDFPFNFIVKIDF